MTSPPDDNQSQDDSRSSSTSAPQFPAETYNYLIQALLSLQSSTSNPYPHNYPPTYPYPTHPTQPQNFNYPWPPPSIAGPSSLYPPHLTPQTIDFSQLTSPPSTTAPTAQDPVGTEDAMSITEDKRRRNTAASARFRVKKKLNTLNLERTVADLTGRTEELEREATDLRRENAWLKEIVLLKGRNLAALNLGSHAPAPENRHDEGEKDDRTHTESEPESTAKRKEKGKDKEC